MDKITHQVRAEYSGAFSITSPAIGNLYSE